MKLQSVTTITAALLAASAWAQGPSTGGPIKNSNQIEAPVATAEPSAPEPGEERQPVAGPERRATDAPPPTPRATQSQIILPAGAWVKIRVDQPISSDRNRAGDGFSGTLTQPIVADGFVIAHRGQTIEGRVTEAIKAGKAKGTSRLGLELTEIGLADGQQMPIRTELIEYSGGTSVGRDVAAVGAATGAGAAIGAAAGGGMGAGIGAIAGAVASGIGVLATRGRATEVYPETVVTFRTLAPIAISTERAPHAFQAVRQTDYERQSLERRPAPQPRPSLYFGAYDPFFYGGPGLWYGSRFSNWGPRYYSPRVFVGGGGRGGYGGRRR